MALPPPPDGLRPVEAADFAAEEARRERVRLGLFLALTVLGGWLAASHWAGDLVGALALLAAFGAGLGGVAVEVLRLRRDVAATIELADVVVEEAEGGPVARWRLAPPVPRRLERLSPTADWAPAAVAGDRIPVRVRENVLGQVQLRPGQPTAEGWLLPTEGARWPISAQLLATLAPLALLVVWLLALAPTTTLTGVVVAAEQDAWVTGEGTTPWTLVVAVPTGAGETRQAVRLPHRRLLELLPRQGQKALATPGLLPSAERSAIIERYRPIGRTVTMRRTRLGRRECLAYVGPES